MANEASRMRPGESAGDQRLLNEFLNDIASSVYLSSPVDASRAAPAVICNLFRHVSGGEVKGVMSQLPAEFHGLLQCTRPDELAERFDRNEFLRRVGSDLGVGSVEESENIARAVLQAFRRFADKELDAFQSQLPKDINELFGPPTGRAA